MAAPFAQFDTLFDDLSQPAGTPSATSGGGGLTQPAAPVASQPQAAPATQPAPQTTPSPSPVPAFPQAGAPPVQAPTNVQPGAAPAFSLTPWTPTTPQSAQIANLFQPFTQDVQRGRTQLGERTAEFSQAAGPFRTPDSANIQSTLEGALAPGADPSDAMSLLTASYAGPRELGDIDTRSLESGLQGINTFGGASNLIRRATSGLTSGQRTLEAQRAFKNPEYQKAALGLQSDLRSLLGDYYGANAQARGIAEQRTGEEADIARASRDYLTGQEGSLEGTLGERAAGTNREADRLTSLYDAYQKSGSAADLAALDAAFDADLTKFSTGDQAKLGQAKVARDAILNDARFASIKDLPLLELAATRKGREALFFDKETAAKLKADGRSTREIKELQALARQRQGELEKLFSPGTAQRAARTTREAGTGFGEREIGSFADVMPIYFGQTPLSDTLITQPTLEGVEAEDPRSYLRLNPATLATAGSAASPEERARLNAIYRLLGSNQSIDEGVPFTPTGLDADSDRYVAAEEARRAQQAENVDMLRKDWLKHIAGKRGRYKKSNTFAAKAGRTAGGVTGFVHTAGLGGGTERGSSLGGNIGSSIG